MDEYRPFERDDFLKGISDEGIRLSRENAELIYRISELEKYNQGLAIENFNLKAELRNVRKDLLEARIALTEAMSVIDEHPMLRAHATRLSHARQVMCSPNVVADYDYCGNHWNKNKENI